MARFDEWNGLRCVDKNLDNANESVGRVTVLHIIFMTILMEAMHGDIGEAAKMFRRLFPSRADSEYKSPVNKEEADEATGLKKITVSLSLVEKAMSALSVSALVKGTIEKACSDFVAFGRMFQEKTIDAAKTGERIVIPYLDQVKQFKLMSRLRGAGDFNVKAAWRRDEACRREWRRITLGGGCIDFAADEGESRWIRLGSVIRYLVRDPSHKVALMLLKTVKAAGLWITSFKPKFSGKLISYIEKEKEADACFRALCRMSCEYKDAYRTITGCMRKEMREVAESAADPDDRRAWERVIRKRYRAMYDELANEMRRGFDILSGETSKAFGTQKRVMANLYASFHDDDGNRVSDESASKFADTVMEEEFFLFMHKCMLQKGETIPEYTEDKLRRCDFPEGAVVDFHGGEAELPIAMEDGREEIFTASAEEEIEGRFVIRLDKNGKKIASRRIADAVQIPAADPTRLVFMTVATPSIGASVDSLIKEAAGKEVVLLNYVMDSNGEKTKQAVLFDGKVVSRFRKMEDWEFRHSPSIVRGFEAVYGGKAGIVSKAVVSVQDVNHVPTTVAVIVLENVHDVDPFKYRNVAPMETSEEKKTSTAPSFLQRVQKRAASSN